MERRAGDERDDAVSPVIGVVLMVAITVIVATVVSAFALTLAEDRQNKPINAAVKLEVDNMDEEIHVQVTSMGNAEYVVMRGPLNPELESSDFEPYLWKTGQQMTLVYDENDNVSHLRERGGLGAVGVRGNFVDKGFYPNKTDHPNAEHVPIAAIIPVRQQTQVAQVDYDFRD